MRLIHCSLYETQMSQLWAQSPPPHLSMMAHTTLFINSPARCGGDLAQCVLSCAHICFKNKSLTICSKKKFLSLIEFTLPFASRICDVDGKLSLTHEYHFSCQQLKNASASERLKIRIGENSQLRH